MSSIQSVIIAFCKSMEGAFIKMFGGWNNELETLVIFMTMDYVTAAIGSQVLKKNNSAVLKPKLGYKGLIKKCYILLFVLISHRLDLAIGVEYIKTTVVVGFIINESLSIVENAGVMGMSLPKTIKNAIEILQDRISCNDTKENKIRKK